MMEQDLQINTNIGCKDLLLKKLSYAVTCSVSMQIILLTVFIFIVNFDLFNPMKWTAQSFTVLTSLSTWLFVVPFLSVIFAQCLICAKDYVLKTTCSSTRIGYFLSVFSIRNIVLLSSHVFSGALFVWLFSVLSRPERRLLVKCGDNYCLNDECLFLILFGVWIGLYYFIWIYATDKMIVFPVIQQKKLLKFQSNFISILKTCQRDAVFSLAIYVTTYYFYGEKIQGITCEFFRIEREESSTRNVFTSFYAYIFAVLYLFNVKLMRFFFEMFLTEPNEFPIVPINNGDLKLKDAMTVNYIPIVQHLACLDLFLLSTESKSRRELIFSLSQPGNHPHNWNSLIETILRILTDYTQSMNNSIMAILNSDQDKKIEQVPIPATNQFVKNYNFGNMRNMVLQDLRVPVEFLAVSNEKSGGEVETIKMKLKNKIRSSVSFIKRRTGINYLFEEVPTTNIQFLLSNGQIIIWTVQGLSSLAVASLNEDKFGVMQKDLPVILSTLVELRQGMEKLNRMPTLARKSQKFDDYSNKMKISITSAVKRSLYQICNNFKPYLKDLPINNDVLQVLHVYTHQ